MNQTSTNRLNVVDALRGFALFAIIIVHCFEHYNLFFIPDIYPKWLSTLDVAVWNSVWFLFAGKAFSTFSLLFGLSFYIQLRNAQKRGESFRGRFVWRLFLLFIFSQLHALFYNGDILFLYSISGLILVALCRCSTKTILIVATVMIMQPLEWARVICAANNTDFFVEYGEHFLRYADLIYPVQCNGSLFDVMASNITDGQLYCNLWQIENGRLFQCGALFLYGMVAGRLELFEKNAQTLKIWRKILLYASIIFIPIYAIKLSYPIWIGDAPKIMMPLDIAIPSIVNFVFALILISIFVLTWFSREDGFKFQQIFIPFGRMSLTNYLLQSIIGVSIFYGYGLGLYKYTGATLCLFIATLIFIVQLYLSHWWLSHHKQGPLENIWKRLTWI